MDEFDINSDVAPEETEVSPEPIVEPVAAYVAIEPEPEQGERVRFGGYSSPAMQKARLEGGAVNAPLEGPATPFTPPKAGR